MPNGQAVRAFKCITGMSNEERLGEILELRQNGHLDRTHAGRLQVLEQTFTQRPTKGIVVFLLAEVIKLSRKKSTTSMSMKANVEHPTATA